MVERALSSTGRLPRDRRRDLTTPLEGTTQTIYPQVQSFWAETYGGSGLYISPKVAELVWVAARCIQLNAQQIAAMPPLAVRAAKRSVLAAAELPLSAGLRAERDAFFDLFATHDQTEGMRAFQEKRPPMWAGR